MSERPFRVGVDGRAFSSPAGGVRRYVTELYRAMMAVDPTIEVLAIGATAATPLPFGLRPHAAIPFPTNLGWMAASIPLAARKAHLDVFHAPAYTAPLWGVHPQVVTIHDVSYERRPEWNAYKNDPLRRLFYRRSALAADCIITDSAFSQSEIAAAYGIPLDRIDVVPLAAAATFEPGPCDSATLPAGVRQPYALHVGDLHVRRNLKTALSAVLAVRRLRPEPLSLVCAGIDRGIGDELRALARAEGNPDGLVLTGPVTEEALLNLYRGATLLVYPSRYEGFGLPILEAMQCGVPVVGADCASIPALVGEAGLLLPPLEVSAWTQAIVAIMTDGATAGRLAAAGIERAARFSWRRTAQETLAILHEAATRGNAQAGGSSTND